MAADEVAKRLVNLEEELNEAHEGRIEDLLKQMDAQGRRQDVINENMKSMLSRFEVGGGYPNGADAMMRDFRECFSSAKWL